MALAVATATICATVIVARASVPAPVLTSARIEHRGPTLELHFGFSGSAPRFHLSTHGSELWIELGRTRVAIPPRPLFGYESAPIMSVRAIQSDSGSRIVVEVTGGTDYAIARLRDRNEIVLRVAATGADPNIAAPIIVHNTPRRPAPPVARQVVYAPAENPRSVPPIPPAAPVPVALNEDNRQPGHFLVMIDPGHGGYDPGTESSAGTAEKTLALQIATRLKAALEARGIRAEMTRSSDVFISLAERTRIANSASADLFVSIHLNSSPNTETTGIEVYYLNNTTDRATIRLARMENGGGDGYGAPDASNLNYILTDLRQNYKASEAASLAKMIDAQTVADLDSGLGMNVNALGAKMGPFYVLVGAHMPAVLVECGFMSNPAEAARLESPSYQDLLARGIATSVADYFDADMAAGNL
ncbi:N-acetylmuramoyl-L-alanine amidase family protein [Candidatus Binatus sp.]|uniref:N-acetylmuramoyl-L-alanine amidase family protein n=2 Tax=Candidatus Binatus sp. TaxID=2811406 RepID=UPI003C7232AA